MFVTVVFMLNQLHRSTWFWWNNIEGGGSGSHYVEASFWRRLWTCRQTE